jgi:hypothetical protein
MESLFSQSMGESMLSSICSSLTPSFASGNQDKKEIELEDKTNSGQEETERLKSLNEEQLSLISYLVSRQNLFGHQIAKRL